jgi:pimeloyl-ACP methyl ester carboxylesterase
MNLKIESPMKKIILLSTLLLLEFCIPNLNSQNIQRRAAIGIYPSEVTPEIAKEKKLKAPEGIIVNQVLPNTTASELALKNGDIILEVNGNAIKTMTDLMTLRTDLRANQTIEMKIWRAGEQIIKRGKSIAIPNETSNSAEIIYDEIPFKEGWLRVIVNKPNANIALGNGKHPTIFFIPGYTCSSVDNFSPIHPYGKLLDSLSGLGYAIFRVEKPGMGDNVNTGDCFQMGFNQELEAYKIAYQHLKDYDFIDLENIHILGHSMGGVYAPLLAADFNPKGVIVYGTSNESWFEYLLRITRYQTPWINGDWIQMEKDARTVTRMWFKHFYEKVPTKELAKTPEFEEILRREFQWDGEDQILGRDEIFWQELHDQNTTEAWAKTSAHVLSLYGEADLPAISPDSHEEIVKIVNTYHPGHGTFKLVPETDHSLIKVGTMQDGINLSGTPQYREKLEHNFNYGLVTMIHEWIQNLAKNKS